MVREKKNGDLDFIHRVYKENLTSPGEVSPSITFLKFSSDFDHSQSEKIENMLKTGETVSLSVDSRTFTVNKGSVKSWKNYSVYNVTLEVSNKATFVVVKASRPYPVMKTGPLLQSFEFRSVDKNYTVKEKESDGSNTPSKAESTNLTVLDLYRTSTESGGSQMAIRLQNTGNSTVQAENLGIWYGPPNCNPVSYSVLKSQTDWTVSTSTGCFDEERTIRPGSTHLCKTGLKFPDPGQNVDITIFSNEFDYELKTQCEVESKGQNYC